MFNLANPRPLRLQHLLFIARVELLITCLCILLSFFCAWQLTRTPASVPPASTQKVVPPPASHPVEEQMALWQLIQNNASDALHITQIEYTGSVWHLQLTSTTNRHLHHWLDTITDSSYFQRWELNTLHQRETTLFVQVTLYP